MTEPNTCEGCARLNYGPCGTRTAHYWCGSISIPDTDESYHNRQPIRLEKCPGYLPQPKPAEGGESER